MSKVEELRAKYPTVTQVTFNKLVDADKTPTKKYLEFLLKMWANKNETGCPSSSVQLIEVVKKFDVLLPYIENKDIYAKEYLRYNALKNIVDKAEQIKEERTFVKEEHAVFYKETENYIILQPKTHKGSCRYGAGTKWCTTGRNNQSIFTNYVKGGLLIYVIRKNTCGTANYDKVALYLNYGQDPFNAPLEIFAANDSRAQTNQMISAGWKDEDVLEIFSIFRHIFFHQKKYKKIKEDINSFVSTISTLNFEKFVENLSKLEHAVDGSYISNIKEKLDIFLNQIQKTTDAIRETKN